LSAKRQSIYHVRLCHLSSLGRCCTFNINSCVKLSQNGGQLFPYEGVSALHTGLWLLPRNENWMLYQAVKFGFCSVKYDSVNW